MSELQHERHRRHAGARDDARRAALELGERVGELRARRVAAARVVVLALPVEALEREVRREVERRHDGAVLRVGGDAGAHGARRGGCEDVRSALMRCSVLQCGGEDAADLRRLGEERVVAVARRQVDERAGRAEARGERLHLLARARSCPPRRRRASSACGCAAGSTRCRSAESESARNRSGRHRGGERLAVVREVVARPGNVASPPSHAVRRDVEPLGELARAAVRRHGERAGERDRVVRAPGLEARARRRGAAARAARCSSGASRAPR